MFTIFIYFIEASTVIVWCLLGLFLFYKELRDDFRHEKERKQSLKTNKK